MKFLKLPSVVLFIVIIFIYFYALSLKVPMNSDGASAVLQAKDMLEGNVFLRNWYLSTGTYITTDLFLYVLLLPFLGFSTNVIYVGSAIFYTGLVIVCMWISAKKKNGISYKRAFATFAIVGLPNLFVTNMVFSGPMHTSSLLYCLLALFIWEYAKNIYVRYGSLFIILTLALIADPFVLWFFVVPFVLACAYKAIRNKSEYISLGIVIGSYVTSKVVMKFVGFNVPSIGETRFVKIDELKKNVVLTIEGILNLYGANFFGQSVSTIVLIVILHLFVLIFTIWLGYQSIKKIDKSNVSTLELFLIIGIMINIVEYVCSNMPINIATTRYILPAFVFFSIYIGKFSLSRINSRKITVALSISLILYALTSLQTVTLNKTVSIYQEVADFLQQKGLTRGYGSYWNSSIVTLESENDVIIRPVVYNGEIVPFAWFSKTSWYSEPTNFLIFDNTNWGDINAENAEKKFGVPDRIYNFNGLTILYWDKDISKEL
ncbi:hypothetical protein [Paenibacillus brevis]|uniref:Glycosyltransferase RgtA/B/C/D-like domain-containing protein n=1 Tax=Paenibacillus brevis TaxID=2841508 RepID=A0ABS6FV98_9BACL|nr:hypothetical protein [Paenibacillus brevis]MBU5673841.1 hypothetical protein [Paenibacillus brevis]